MWRNSEFRTVLKFEIFSDGFWAVLKNRDSAFGEFSTKIFWRKEYEKS